MGMDWTLVSIRSDNQATSMTKVTTAVNDKYPMLALAVAVPTLRVIAALLPESVCDEVALIIPLGERIEMDNKPRPSQIAL